MNTYFKSDVGITRSDNQDFCYCDKLPDGAILSVICDGMGGVTGGRIASEIAVKAVFENVFKYYDNMKNISQKIELMNDSIYIANSVVFEISTQEAQLQGMGTTLVLTFIENNVAHIFHVGDSRAYLIRDNSISAITKDHSFVQEMLDIGQLSYESAKHHPKKNIITRALGVSDFLNVDYNKSKLLKDDMILLCTDGLTNEVTDESILKIITSNTIENICSKLVEKALASGGSDNVTVVVIG